MKLLIKIFGLSGLADQEMLTDIRKLLRQIVCHTSGCLMAEDEIECLFVRDHLILNQTLVVEIKLLKNNTILTSQVPTIIMKAAGLLMAQCFPAQGVRCLWLEAQQASIEQFSIEAVETERRQGDVVIDSKKV